MILYTYNQSPAQNANPSLFPLLTPEDGMLFFEDGVYFLIATAVMAETITTIARTHPCYALAADVIARGLQGRLIPEVKLISYEDWVDLSVVYQKVINL